jgi:GNAT superfamily N-acetyltransferase
MKIVNDVDKSILVMQDASRWMSSNKVPVTKWWELENLNKEFLLKYAKPEEFYVGMIGETPAVAAILQCSQEAQDWKTIDGDNPRSALYVHWLAVSPDYKGKALTARMIEFASRLAKENGVNLLRADTDASSKKLGKVYERLGFKLAGTKKEDYRETAFYQKEVK